MGDVRTEPPAADLVLQHQDIETAPEEVTVLVTGFGPFLAQFPINPSHEITKLLPTTLLPDPSEPTNPRIRLIIHPSPLPVAYHPTATIVPTILSARTPDLVLHLGLAAGRNYFALERSSVRIGYGRNKDVLGQRWTDVDSDRQWPSHLKAFTEGDGKLCSYPDRLATSLPFEDIWRRWRSLCADIEGVGDGTSSATYVTTISTPPHQTGVPIPPPAGAATSRPWNRVEVRPSDDVGSFLCGFIYWTTLAWFWALHQQKQKEDKEREYAGLQPEPQQPRRLAAPEDDGERPVLFLHVPGCPEERDLQRGKEITVAAIRAMVASWLGQKRRRANDFVV
ncbi:uncharacterized protein J3D65DRAFT_615892 [Phyllosticta citribraziliensis]|uniref:Peptidase C15, pyroglutamyl peptidase I-like protein n=1 Tax=Phyllosticta citribraziliensis TaxID=989973 RepID=A0ABR1LZI3_9PEZI